MFSLPSAAASITRRTTRSFLNALTLLIRLVCVTQYESSRMITIYPSISLSFATRFPFSVPRWFGSPLNYTMAHGILFSRAVAWARCEQMSFHFASGRSTTIQSNMDPQTKWPSQELWGTAPGVALAACVVAFSSTMQRAVRLVRWLRRCGVRGYWVFGASGAAGFWPLAFVMTVGDCCWPGGAVRR